MSRDKLPRNGAVAAGHPLTAETAKEILRAGGNAFDAAIAAHFAACVTEPVLASLGGGGFLLAQTQAQEQWLFDFFVQTPQSRRDAEDIDFKPIVADFGATQQEFHIGQGSIATPGTVKGLFEIHRRLGSIPMRELLTPAIEFARKGIELNAFQAYIFEIVSPILLATPEAAATFGNATGSGRVLQAGQRFQCPRLSDTLEMLGHEGDDLFYRGDLAKQMVEQNLSGGGFLEMADLESYRVVCREPLEFTYRNNQIVTNPPPSSGGVLIAFALQLWNGLLQGDIEFGDHRHLALLAEVMRLTNQARIEAHLDGEREQLRHRELLDENLLLRYRKEIRGRAKAMRGTTHISIIDRWHNVATMTVSNGEGCGSMVPGTGIMLNNMLGEEDLNPGGFHRWAPDQRMTSMMAPTVINRDDGSIVALGSGGSNRIRTALLQVIINLIDFHQGLGDSIDSPRIHFEKNLLNIEAGYHSEQLKQLAKNFDQLKEWDDLNLFFGGVHAVMERNDRFHGAGDQRRGGVCELL